MAFSKVTKITTPTWSKTSEGGFYLDNLKTETGVNILQENGSYLLTEVSIWSLVSAVTTPTWSNITNVWYWENKMVNWEDEITPWEDSGN